MQKTYLAKKSEIKRAWYLFDAQDKILGRLAVEAAKILRGKHKPSFTPNIDCGDNVIVINASKVKVSGRKMTQKVYRRYSGYPGGLREVGLGEMLKNKPTEVIRLAVSRMLPSGPLGRDLLKKLKIYSLDKHPHTSVTFEVNSFGRLSRAIEAGKRAPSEQPFQRAPSLKRVG